MIKINTQINSFQKTRRILISIKIGVKCTNCILSIYLNVTFVNMQVHQTILCSIRTAYCIDNCQFMQSKDDFLHTKAYYKCTLRSFACVHNWDKTDENCCLERHFFKTSSYVNLHTWSWYGTFCGCLTVLVCVSTKEF